MVKYEYDSWGNHIVKNADGTINNSADFIGNLNPIRYRGYYYDSDINLYYLKTRYYDPETGRFVTIDDVKFIAPNIINGLNLYAYCANNPVLYIDPKGTSFLSFLKILFGVVAGAFFAIGAVLVAGIVYLMANSKYEVRIDPLYFEPNVFEDTNYVGLGAEITGLKITRTLTVFGKKVLENEINIGKGSAAIGGYVNQGVGLVFEGPGVSVLDADIGFEYISFNIGIGAGVEIPSFSFEVNPNFMAVSVGLSYKFINLTINLKIPFVMGG